MELNELFDKWWPVLALLAAQVSSYGGLKIQLKTLQEKISRWDCLLEDGGFPMCRFHAQLFNQMDARINKLESKIEEHRR